jgi:hypothetical protein
MAASRKCFKAQVGKTHANNSKSPPVIDWRIPQPVLAAL